MSPKFRGGSDDWLDDEDQSAGARSKTKKPQHARATALPWEEANASVVEVYPNQARLRMDSAPEGVQPLCSYRRAGVVQKGEVRERTLVAVGDRVKASLLSPDAGVIEGVCERKNRLSRPAPGKLEKNVQHVIAANLDAVVIVASAREPEFTPGLVDRFLIAVQAAGISPLICVTKMDLLAGKPDHPGKLYSELGFEVVEVCAKTGLGIASFREKLTGKTILFCGQSGVGKTSLLRVLLQKEIGRVGEVSQSTGKGRHTTTSTVMLGGPQGSCWMDSPGVREFGLVDITPETLAGYYPEFLPLRCSTSHCMHDGEPGCQATGLPRHTGYRRILESLRAGEN